VNGLRPAGRQKTNCIVLQMRWNSMLISMFHVPSPVLSVVQIGSFPSTSCRWRSQQLNTERPADNFSLVMRLVSRTIWPCWTIYHTHTHTHATLPVVSTGLTDSYYCYCYFHFCSNAYTSKLNFCIIYQLSENISSNALHVGLQKIFLQKSTRYRKQQ